MGNTKHNLWLILAKSIHKPNCPIRLSVYKEHVEQGNELSTWTKEQSKKSKLQNVGLSTGQLTDGF